VSVANGLDALQLILRAYGIGPGDEVIVPSFTFVSSANAFALRGARPVFADVLPDTFTLDPDHVRRLIGPRTRAVVPVHYAGVPCEMDELAELTTECDAALVEDNAHGFLATYKGRLLGTLGRLGTLSFHDTKNFTCGEGGAIIINDSSLVERAEVVREKGTDRSRFFRGQVDKYTWVDVGSSYLPSDILAAVLLAQLEESFRIQAAREQTWNCYMRELADWATELDIGLPVVPAYTTQAFHMFFLVMPDESTRREFIAHLGERGVLSVFHYLPLHLSAMGQRFGGQVGDCPVSEWVSDRLVRLPMFTDITPEQREHVIRSVLSFRPTR
jgi:dTDP-4-amino-4,6-dideoxygalactose transaminase